MPVIRISDGTMQRLKAWAEPLEDTAESALAKALDAAEQSRKRPPSLTSAKRRPRIVRRPVPGAKLPQRDFREPLMEVLYEMGGSVRVTDLRPIMKKKMMSRLLPGDLERVSTGDERWWNATCWERSNLVKEGYLRSDSLRGTWELSELGVELVEMSKSGSPEPFVEHLLAMPEVGEDADFERDHSGPRQIEL